MYQVGVTVNAVRFVQPDNVQHQMESLKKLVFPSTKIQNRENTLLFLRLIPAFPSFSKAFTSRLIRKCVVDIQWYLAAQREYNLEYICLRYNSADKWKAFCALSIFLLRYLNIQSAYDWKEEL